MAEAFCEELTIRFPMASISSIAADHELIPNVILVKIKNSEKIFGSCFSIRFEPEHLAMGPLGMMLENYATFEYYDPELIEKITELVEEFIKENG